MCIRDRFQHETNQTSCKSCPGGWSQGLPRETECNLCGMGTFATGIEQEACSDCIAGMHAAQNETELCRDCPAGWSRTAVQGHVCNLCSAGKIAASNGSVAVGRKVDLFDDKKGTGTVLALNHDPLSNGDMYHRVDFDYDDGRLSLIHI